MSGGRLSDGGGHRLVGRDAEVALVADRVSEAVTARRRAAIVVEGGAGTGVSALAAIAVRTAVAAGADVARVTITDSDTSLDDDLRALAVGADDAPPTVVVVEHVHRAGTVAAEALRALVADPGARPLVVVLTTLDNQRPPVADVVDAVLRAGGVHVRLEALGEMDATALAERELGAALGPILRRLLARAGGVPLAIIELIAGLQRDGRVGVRDGVAEVERAELSPSVRDRLLGYVRDLPGVTVDVLQVAAALAVDGAVVDITDLGLVLARPVADLVNDLDPAIAAGVLRADGARLAFRHRLVADALHESMAPAVRAAVHAEIASVLHAAGRPDVGIARHIVPADGLAPAALAADVAWRLRRDEPALALEVCEAALAGDAVDGASRDRLATASAWPAVTQGRIADAADLVRGVLDRPHDPALDVELHWCLVAALQRAGEAERARDGLVRLVARPGLDPDERRWLSRRVPGAYLSAGDIVAAERAAEVLLADAGATDDPDTVLATSSALVLGRLAQGRVADAVDIAERAAIVRRQRRPPEGVGIVLPMALIEADRFDDARAALRDALRREVDPTGDAALLSVYDIWLVIVDVLAGNWDDAAAGADAVWQHFTTSGSAVSAPWALAYPALVHLRRDDVDRADAHVRAAEDALERHGPQNGADVVLWARSLVLEARGATADAAATLAAEWDLTRPVRWFQSWRGVAPDLVRLSLAAGHRDRAVSVTEDAEEGSRRAPDVPSAQGAALRCRGLLDADPDVLAAAVETLRRGPRRPDTVAAAHDAGVALAVAGRRAEAVAVLDLGRSLAHAIGARVDLRRIEGRLSALGAAPRRSASGRVAEGWDGLTARESEVVALVADGLSNPEIAERLAVSRHTVESHLKRVYLKLRVTSRAQLAAAELRHRRRT